MSGCGCKQSKNAAAARLQQKIHRADIMRPSEKRGTRGQITGEAKVIARGVLYAFRPLNGREREIARQEFASASSVVTLHLNRSWGLKPTDFFIRRSGPHAGKRLNIGYIKDEEGLGLDTEIICGEGDLS